MPGTVSAQLAIAQPRRVKATHRRRRKITAGHFVQRYYDPGIGRFLSVDPVAARETGDNFNRYWYADNNPYKFTDPDGRDSYLVSRPINNVVVGCCASHNFIVTNAKYIGDPKASVYSFGRNNEGKTGRVDGKTVGLSKGTSDTDVKSWRMLAADRESRDPNTTQINAPDSKVAATAEALIENTTYAKQPGGKETNSNSAASAVANRAQGSPVEVPGGNRLSPGADQSEKISFKPIKHE